MRLRGLLAMLWAMVPFTASAVVPESFAYGPQLLQTLDVYRARVSGPAPLILFVHGGGWSSGSRAMGARSQPVHFLSRGFAWATMSYRLVPTVRVEDQAADVARAVAWVRNHARRLGIDPDRIVLMGHSAGGHLAALVGTDPQWLAVHGLSPDMVRGIVTLDAAGLDVVTAMAPGGGASHYHAPAFGTDPNRQALLSPSTHAGVPPNARHWAMLFDVDNNPGAGRHAETLAAGLNAAGSQAQVVAVTRTTHMGMLNRLGQPADPATALIDDYLKDVMAQVVPASELRRLSPDRR